MSTEPATLPADGSAHWYYLLSEFDGDPSKRRKALRRAILLMCEAYMTYRDFGVTEGEFRTHCEELGVDGERFINTVKRYLDKDAA